MLYMLGETNNCVFGWIKPLVAVATYSFHRLIMEKSGNMRGGGGGGGGFCLKMDIWIIFVYRNFN